jgi:hypothetical protein
VVAGHGEEGCPEPAQECGRLVVLLGPAAVREVAARNDQLGCDLLHQRADPALDRRIVLRAEVQVRDVEDARSHRRSRL